MNIININHILIEPGAPPRVNVGSFFESDVTSLERDIYVYWQQVPLEIRNGERFGYDVIVNDDPKSLVHSTSSNAKFSKMSVNTTFKFTIRSKNVVGLSEETAVLVVPAQSDCKFNLRLLFYLWCLLTKNYFSIGRADVVYKSFFR